MSHVLYRIERTREALVGALMQRDWAAIGELDLACRACMDEVIEAAQADRDGVQSNLEKLLHIYRELLEAAMGERRAVVDEMSQITQAQNAAKVYHLFR